MSRLVITTPAESLALLTDAEMRVAAGLSFDDDTLYATLEALGLSVAASIMSECNIAVGLGGEPTLLRETLTETLRNVYCSEILLARRHAITITSIVEDGVTLSASDYEVNPESGMVMRLSSDSPIRWCAAKVVVVYDAGFETAPSDLKQAAIDCFKAFWNERQRDPFVKSEEIDIPDVERTKRDYWVGSVPGQASEGAVPDIVSGQLKRFRMLAVA